MVSLGCRLRCLLAIVLATLIGGAPVELRSQSPTDTIQASLARVLDSAARARQFSGVILLAHDGAVTWHREYEFANRERRIPNTLSTRLNISSVGKLFTQT